MGYTQKNNPFPVTSCGRRRTYMQDGGKPKKVKMNKEEKMSFDEKNSSLNNSIINEMERKYNLKKVEGSPLKKSCPAGEAETGDSTTPTITHGKNKRKKRRGRSWGECATLGQKIGHIAKQIPKVILPAAVGYAMIKGRKKNN